MTESAIRGMSGACYNCRWRRSLLGDVHSRCDLGRKLGKNDAELILASVNGEIERPRFHAIGVSRGWATWPINFDPIWLRHCAHFEDKDKPSES